MKRAFSRASVAKAVTRSPVAPKTRYEAVGQGGKSSQVENLKTVWHQARSSLLFNSAVDNRGRP
jgi:hypothetical protein